MYYKFGATHYDNLNQPQSLLLFIKDKILILIKSNFNKILINN